PMAEALWTTPSSRRDELEHFARSRPEIAAYARFRGEREGEGPAADRATGYHLYAQWAAEQQLEAVGERLLLDFPVGVHPDGFDAAWRSSSFAGGAEVGAPPDTFFEQGQRWGFRPMHPRAIREDGYRYLIDCLRHVMRRAGVLRLDHVMSLQRLYWVPDGYDATHGVYVRYPLEELRAVVCVEAARSATAVVGEDLGTVPGEVRAAMTQDRMLRTWVLQLEMQGPGERLPTPTEMSVASLGTHDLPRFAAWWGAGAADALRPCLDHLAGGPSRMVMVDIEDLWLERRPHNRPGTTTGNWRHRSDRTLEELKTTADLLARVDRLRREGGDAARAPTSLDAAAPGSGTPAAAVPAPTLRAPARAGTTPAGPEPPVRRRRRWWRGGERGDPGGQR
ncbi:MAG: 4-alpha-glucanotransferase, partial [Acidimicrobiales bacterium]